MKPTWEIVVLAALGCFMACVTLGICVWAIERGFAPPSLLIAPISTVLVGGAAAIVAHGRGYADALMRLPPAPPGTEYRLVRSYSPPPTDEQLAGRVPLPRPPLPSGVDLSGDAAIPIADARAGRRGADDPAEPLPDTNPDSPSAKRAWK